MTFSAGSSSSTISSEINVTPLIDVLLVLLIIFMVIAPVMPRGLDSRIPQPSVTAERSDSPVSVRLLEPNAASGQAVVYEIDGRVVQPGQLEAALVASLGRRSNRSVFVAASPLVSYRVVAEMVGEARAAGATAVALGRL